jgi:hypothetical protein
MHGAQVWWFLGPDIQCRTYSIYVYRPPIQNVLFLGPGTPCPGFPWFLKDGARDLWILNSITNNPTELDRKKERKN